jgi:uncharacterized protein (TIGR02452 family)
MYDWHRANAGALYASWVIYSPNVPVFRDDNEELLPEPWSVSILTSPAPNVWAYKSGGGGKSDTEIAKVISSRAARILSLACDKGHDSLVLGAWGCGVFGCDPEMVARVFRDLLTVGPFKGVFREVVFAIPAGLNHDVFREVFRA